MLTLPSIANLSIHSAILISYSGLRQDQAVCHRDQETGVCGGDYGGLLWISGNLHWHSCGSGRSLHL